MHSMMHSGMHMKLWLLPCVLPCPNFNAARLCLLKLVLVVFTAAAGSQPNTSKLTWHLLLLLLY
jgi:hypothetical protein